MNKYTKETIATRPFQTSAFVAKPKGGRFSFVFHMKSSWAPGGFIAVATAPFCGLPACSCCPLCCHQLCWESLANSDLYDFDTAEDRAVGVKNADVPVRIGATTNCCVTKIPIVHVQTCERLWARERQTFH